MSKDQENKGLGDTASESGPGHPLNSSAEDGLRGIAPVPIAPTRKAGDLLQVGDELMGRSGFRGDVLSAYKITRVTAQFAWAGEHTKYRREVKSQGHYSGKSVLYARLSGETYESHELMTDELRAEYHENKRRRSAMRVCRDMDFDSMTTDQLEQIAAIAKAQGNS